MRSSSSVCKSSSSVGTGAGEVDVDADAEADVDDEGAAEGWARAEFVPDGGEGGGGRGADCVVGRACRCGEGDGRGLSRHALPFEGGRGCA